MNWIYTYKAAEQKTKIGNEIQVGVDSDSCFYLKQVMWLVQAVYQPL